jgi:hypothetical protein
MHAGESTRALECSHEVARLADRITDREVLARVLCGSIVIDMVLGRGLRRDALLRVEAILEEVDLFP